MVSLQALKIWLASPKVKNVLDKISLAVQAIRRITGSGVPAFVLLLLVAQNSHAAIASLGWQSAADNRSATGSWSFSASAQLEQNNVSILLMAVDINDTTAFNPSLSNSVSDEADSGSSPRTIFRS
jgi:hypothetical protein